MKESYKTTFNIKSTHYKKIEEISSILTKRGVKGTKGNSTRDMILNELLSSIPPDCYNEVIEKITPLEFLYKEGIRNPSIKKQLEKILRKDTRRQDKKQTKSNPSEQKKLLS